jgi:hypothetical protein
MEDNIKLVVVEILCNGVYWIYVLHDRVLGPTQPPIQWERGALSLGVKRPGREADHSPPSSAEVKE